MEEGSKQNTAPVARAGEARRVKHTLWSNLQENVLGYSTARWVTNDGGHPTCLNKFKDSGFESQEDQLMRSKNYCPWYQETVCDTSKAIYHW